MDVRNALKLQFEYDRTQRELKKELLEAQQKFGLTMLKIRQTVK